MRSGVTAEDCFDQLFVHIILRTSPRREGGNESDPS